MRRLKLKFPGAVLLPLIALWLMASAGFCAEGPLPKGQTIAVLVQSDSTQHARSAEAILIRRLIAGGYKAVDQKQLETIRKNKAAALALDGNVEAILQLSKTYGFNVLVSGRASVPSPVKNEFGLFTSTASLAVRACRAANGRQVFADTVSAKEVGYTGAEAGQKALEAAANEAARRLVEGASSPANAVSRNFEIEVSGLRSFVGAHGAVESCTRAGCGSASLVRFSGGKALVRVSWAGDAASLARAVVAQAGNLALAGTEGDRILLTRK